MALNKDSKAYQGLLAKGYSDAEIEQMANSVNSGKTTQQAFDEVKSQRANTQSTSTSTGGSYVYNPTSGYYEKQSTPTTTATKATPSTTATKADTSYTTNVDKPEYQGGNANKPMKQDLIQDHYTYSPATGYYEKDTNQNYAKIRDAWNSKTYEQQQEILKNNPSLKDSVIKAGGTIKSAPTGVKQSPYQSEGPGYYEYNPQSGYYEKVKDIPNKNGGWDYQDNSQARMDEIANNLNNYRITNPELFNNWDDFYNFFIAGKGRSPEQEKFLTDYYNNMKKFNQYDNMSSDAVGQGLVNGTIPDDYLNYLKNTDPQRYAEIQEARKNAENQIMNETYLNTVASQAGYEMGDSDFWKWNQEEMGYRDANKDGLDDRLYHAPTAEELKLVDENNQYEQERAKLTDAMKWLQEDLTNQYPDADLSTIMLLTSDRGNKIQRALDTLAVNQTKVQGSLKYLQNERATMDDAGQKTINEIQKQYGMYYDYSPEGIAELAQAQYAATNVTLDQADNGTDTQKQMALDRVLSDYYDKYGSIIQRSKSQVINDVMAYAKNNGVSLSQALEDTFLKFLRQKPGFTQLSSYSGGNPDVFKIGEDTYGYWDENGNLVPIGGNLGGGYNPTGGLFGYTDYTPITSQQLTNGIDRFMSQHPLNSDGGQCGSFVNDYLQSLGYDRLYDDPIDKKKAITNSDTAVKGAIAVMDSKNYPQNGHTAIVTDVRGDKVHLLESNWGDDEKVHERWVNKSDILGYFDPSKSSTTPKDVLNNKFTGDPDWNQNGYFNGLVPYFNTLIKDGKLDLTDTKYKEKLKDYGITDKEFDQMAQNYANTELKGTGGSQASRALEMAIKTYEYLYGPSSKEVGWMPNGSTWLGRQVSGFAPFTDVGKAKTEFESMLNRLTLKELFDAKALGATFGAMSKDEWDVLANASTDVKWGAGNFKENMEDLIESLYTATIDGKAQLPKNWDGSQAQNMVNNRITNGTSLGNYGNATTTKSSTSRFNAPTYVNTQSTLNGEIDWDSIWNQ